MMKWKSSDWGAVGKQGTVNVGTCPSGHLLRSQRFQ